VPSSNLQAGNYYLFGVNVTFANQTEVVSAQIGPFNTLNGSQVTLLPNQSSNPVLIVAPKT